MIYSAIVANPGLTHVEIARIVGLNYQQVRNALPSLETKELLVYEDDERRLYPMDTNYYE